MHENAGDPASLAPAGSEKSRDTVKWQHPLEPRQIEMRSDTLRTLAAESLRFLLTEPSAEVGGILWGHFEQNATETAATVIEQAEFVSRDTPLFNITAADAAKLKQALDRRHGKSSVTAVGYFRSHVREGLCLSPEDQSFVEAEMRDSRSLVLLIRPYQIGICMAGFFFWENGRLQTDTSDLEVPFIALEDRSGQGTPVEARDIETVVPQDEPVAQPVEVSEPPTVLSTPAPVPAAVPAAVAAAVPAAVAAAVPAGVERVIAPPASPPVLFKTIASAVLLGAIAAGALYFAPALWKSRAVRSGSESTTRSAANGINLQVLRVGNGQLDLTWNSSAPQLADAQEGTLTVQDGGLRRTLELGKTELRSGKLAYFPVEEDVAFRLDVSLGGNHHASESLRVLSPRTNVKPASTATNEGERDGGRAPSPLIYNPPRPVKTVMPDTGLIDLRTAAADTQVKIQVDVDTTGKVTQAQVIASDRNKNSELLAAALSAAKKWAFTPARLRGAPVAATHTIAFQFTRQPSR
jgi:TonB family protein